MPTVKVNSASMVAEQKKQQIICLFKNFVHLCNTNHIDQRFYAKKYSSNIEAAYGCKSRDFSTLVDVVGSDCLFSIYSKTF